MKLNYEKIKEITHGAVRVEQEDDGIHFYRFTQEQEKLYKKYNHGFYCKTFSSPGVKLKFKTNSKNLGLKVGTSVSSTRKYFSFDIFINGEFFDSLDNFSDMDLPLLYPKIEYELGEFNKDFNLGTGEKEITVYFPFSVKSVLKEVILDDGACIEKIECDKKMLMFGDSITHGYDSMHPSNSYASKLSDALGVECINKGIGGEVFFPGLAKTKDDIIPDYITVAYGTNDWNKTENLDIFKRNCKEFFKSLSDNYPKTKIFAITPIWRKDFKNITPVGDFDLIEKYIKETAENLENVVCISGFDLIPHDERFFGDLYLHPNDEGFKFYFENLYKEIKKYI